MAFTIYLVKDLETDTPIKVGCTEKYQRRTWENRNYYKRKHKTLIEMEILEETSDIHTADKLEKEYSLMYGLGNIKPQDSYITRYITGIKNNRDGNWASRAKGNNPNYGTGKLYKELTTGFQGTLSDMNDRFNVKGSDIANKYVHYNRPIRKGKLKNLHFVVVS